jgi:hypothetical protein
LISSGNNGLGNFTICTYIHIKCLNEGIDCYAYVKI